ncbi:MAG: nucleoside 2-deoxyribosyltransferase [Deltaproteobacteria bacterium]|jgi:nucleoside 2-deoxyribosyltransferase|nr:nucleoside 2-deoxyribosyltransferase [Deltaproteobacteria bacterium]
MLVYFAGPDVFFPTYQTTMETIRALTKPHGIVPIFPGESVLTDGQAIADSCMRQIDRSDGVIANLNPFHGQEPDSGTVFECGYAIAKGKWVIGYLSDLRDALTKLREWDQGPGPNSVRCQDGSDVENFNEPLNIMLAKTVKGLYASVEEAIKASAAFIPSISSNL